MRFSSRLRVLIAALSVAAFCVGGVPAFAGTTGSLSGTVLDDGSHVAIANARVSVTSPSAIAATTTDAAGRFTFIALAPDTYQISIEKPGFEPALIGGISILADQSQSLSFTLRKTLHEIGRVTTRSSLNVVKPGGITDVYSADAAVTKAAATLGGGGSLNNAYSAIAAFPGAYVPPGQMGVNQSVYIRGGYFDQIGYEYDGVPVNRSFDNYPGHSASTLGQQELQVYTGGGGAGASATGLAGFINQVVKSGTYPGSATLSGRLGGPAFYHDVSAEVGGATPSRSFSYYIGTSGYNQDFRYFDDLNGADLMNLFPYTVGPSNITTNLPFYPAVYPTCNPNLSNPLQPSSSSSSSSPPTGPLNNPGCFSALNPAYSSVSTIVGRETLGNFHFSLPHHRDGGHDDIQLLYTNSAQFRQYYSSPNDAGLTAVNGPVIGGATWPDYVTYPAGTPFLAPADVQPIAYFFPGSPRTRCANTPITVAGSCPDGQVAALPNDYRDGRWDSASIVKLQFQKNIGSRAYVRVFGYTFYSNTNRSGATRRAIGSGFGATNYDYEVDTHTRGAELQFGDQLSDKHALSGWANDVSAKSLRLNNFNYFNTGGQAVSNLTNGTTCFAASLPSSSSPPSSYPPSEPPPSGVGVPWPCNSVLTQGTFESPTQGQTVNCHASPTSSQASIPSGACAAGASWRLTYTGNQGGLNQVVPTFAAAALADEWRPNAKLDVNLGMRLERDEYDLANTDTPDKNFWFRAAQREYCYNPKTLEPLFVPQPPQNLSEQIPVVTFNCPVDTSSGTPVQTVHPDGQDGHLLLSNHYDPQLVQSYFLPRVGATYTLNPDTVLRVSAGRYAQQPQAYEIQYNSVEPNLANQLIGFFPYGFTTPRHDAQPQYSNNFDFSYERHFRGTDMSLKATPYYRYSTNQLYGVNAANSSASLNTGIERSTGIELELTKGDFRRDGLSGLFSYTYLDSKERWANFQGTDRNPVDLYNDGIVEYNALTEKGGGAKCYFTADGGVTPDPHCGSASIRNPYYGQAPQALFDKNGWYQTGLDFPYLSPHVFALVVNYRHRRFAVTPALSLSAGTWYGNPNDVIGIDPRTCSSNQGQRGIPNNDPLRADYTSCGSAATPSGSLFVPNPETGHFDGFGEFQQPWQLNGGLQLNYDVSAKTHLNVAFTNLINRCFGGSSTPWSSAYPPSASVCGYQSNLFYINNFYNGNSPNDVAANQVPLNPYFAHSYVPSYADVSAFNFANPLGVFLQVTFDL